MLFKYIDLERLIHSVKTCIACILGFLLTKFIGFPADQWIVITIIVLMCAQIYVGSVVQKAYSRFLGTVIGCLFAAVVLMSAGNSTAAIAATIGLSSFIFSYIATGQESLSYAGTLGAVTTAIIMLNQVPTLTLAAERFLEISIGLFIASVISQFVLPIHASTHLRRSQATTLEQLKNYYSLVMMQPEKENIDITDLDEQIVKALIKQRQLAKESARERDNGTFDSTHFMQSLYCEREILRSITYMHHALQFLKKQNSFFLKLSSLQAFNQTIMESLTIIIEAINKNGPHTTPAHVPSSQALKEEFAASIENTSRDELVYMDGFLFSAQLLTNSLEKLIKLYNIPVHEDNVLN
ncbi:MAG: FUSC family protein [Gammaproteobacteria bacterium]|nr:FUSC family protein [Gammaproteobacteria bacterium]